MAQDGFSKITVDIDLTDGQDVAKLQQYIKQFEQVIKNLTEDGKAFSSALRRGEKSVSKDFYVAQSRLSEAKKGFEFVRSNVVGSGDLQRMHDPFQISKPSDVSMESFRKLLSADRREVAAIKAQVMRLGGTMEPAKQQGYYDITMPNVAAETATGKPTTTRRLVEKKIRDANYETREAEKRAQLEEHKDNYAKFLEKEADKESKEEARLTSKMVSAFNKKPKDSDGKPSEDENKDSGGSSQLSKLATLGKLYLIIKYIQIIADFAKKIFDAIGGLASQAKEDTKTGLTVGLSGLAVRNYAQAEVLKSLPSGTVTGALETIVQKFGVVSQLDQSALAKLALVLREDTAAVVQTGLGGEDPEQVMDIIVKDYLDRALSGVNAEGLQVGPRGAIRNLVAQLGTVSKDMANILSAQFYEAIDRDDPTRSQAARGPTSEWMLQAKALINPTGVNNEDYKATLEVNKTLGEIKTLWTGIRDGVLMKILLMLSGVIDSLRNAMRLGMSKEMLYADVESAKAANTQKIKDSEVFLGTSASVQSRTIAKIRSQLPEEIRSRMPESAFIQSGKEAFSGQLQSNTWFADAIAANPAMYTDIQGLGDITASIQAVRDFIKELQEANARDDTKHFTGSFSDVALAARGKASVIDTSSSAMSSVRRRANASVSVRNEHEVGLARSQVAMVEALNKTHNKTNNAYAVPAAVESSRQKTAADLEASYAAAQTYIAYTARERSAGRVPVPRSSTTASVTSQESILTVDLRLNGKSLFSQSRTGGMADTVVPIDVNMASLNGF